MDINSRITKTENIRWKDIGWLQPDKFKELKKDSFEKLKTSLKHNGFAAPFFVWDAEPPLILDGVHRKRAMLELEAEGNKIPDELPANFVKCKDRKEALKLVLVYSSIYARATEESLYEMIMTEELDFDELKLEIDLPEISMPKFEAGYMTDEVVEDEAPEPPTVARTVKGDLYELGRHRLLCGDSTNSNDVARLMDGKKARLVVTSPPYANQREYSQWDTYEKYLEFIQDTIVVLTLIRDNDFIVCWNIGSDEAHRNFIPADNYFQFKKAGFEWIEWIVWNKESATWTIPRSQHISNGIYIPALKWESICVFVIGNRPHFDGKDIDRVRLWQENVWEINKVIGASQKKIGHPAIFPVEIPLRCIVSYSKEGECCFEPFCGSGSTLIAAEQTNRVCYGMEIEPRYCDVIVQRYINFTKNNKVKLNGKEIDWA